MIEIMESLFIGLLIGGGYGVVGSLVALVAAQSMSLSPRDLPPRQYYAMTLLWPLTLAVFICLSVKTFVVEVYPILRGPTKHQRALADIERLEAEEMQAMIAWERNRNAQLRDPNLKRWEQESEDDRG
jgi:hypothetical protein